MSLLLQILHIVTDTTFKQHVTILMSSKRSKKRINYQVLHISGNRVFKDTISQVDESQVDKSQVDVNQVDQNRVDVEVDEISVLLEDLTFTDSKMENS